MKGIYIALLVVLLLVIAAFVPSPALVDSWALEASGSSPFMTVYGQFVALAAAAAVLIVHIKRKQVLRFGAEEERLEVIQKVDTLTLSCSCIAGALIGARLLYCLVRFDFYFIEMGALSVLRIWEGGFLLYGALAGVLIAAALLAKAKRVSFAHLCDELALPGMMSVVVARLAERFTTEGVGVWLENEFFCRFPFAVQNEYGEWQLAVFLMEALAAMVILFFIAVRRDAPGERALTALLLYAACQVFFESLRMDACLKIGFVRVSQVFSGVTVFAVILIRALRVGRKPAAVCGGVCLGCIAAAGIIEWALDKTPVNNLLLYAVMIVVCAVMIALGMRYVKKEAQ